MEFNFIKNQKLKTIFANPLDTNDILLRISALTNEIKEAFVFTTKNIEILDRNTYLLVYMLMYLRERKLPNKKIVFKPI